MIGPAIVVVAGSLLLAEPAHLEPGKPVERELAGGQAHEYEIALLEGQYIQVVVDEGEVDVAGTLVGPDGQKLAENDVPNRGEDPKPVSLIAGAAGTYRLQVRSIRASARKGRYTLRIKELRMATPDDPSRITAERVFWEGERLRLEATAESRRKAIEKYQAALPLWRDAKALSEEAETLHNLAFVHAAMGEKQKALEYYALALPLREAAGDPQGRAATLNNMGAVCRDLGERQRAVEYYQQALTLSRSVGDRRGEASTLNSLGLLCSAQGDSRGALEYYRQSLPLRRAVGDQRGEASTLHNIGRAHANLGELQEALDNYNQALRLKRSVGERSGEAVTLYAIGSVYFQTGDFPKALDTYGQVLTMHRAAGDQRGEAVTLSGIGAAYDRMNEFRKALDYYRQALPLSRTVGDRRTEAITLNSMGTTLRGLGEKENALDHYNQSLSLSRAVGDRATEASALGNIGEVSASLGDRQRALDSYLQAVSLSRTTGRRRVETETLLNLARFYRDQEDLPQALQAIEAALRVVESLRADVDAPDLRSSYVASIHAAFELNIDLLMRLHQLDPSRGRDAESLQVAERSRARSLLDLLAVSNAQIRQGVDAALLEQERILQREMSASVESQIRLLGGKHTEEQAAAAAKEVQALTAEHDQLRSQIRTASPGYAALKQPQPSTLPEIQRELDSETLLLEYALGKDRSYLWAVTPTSLTSHTLPNRREIEKAARNLCDLLTARNRRESSETAGQRRARIAQAERSLERAAQGLSRMLLEPVAAQLAKKRLVVVGDGALLYVPFAALADPNTKGDPYVPLMLDHEIVNLPSASILSVLRRELAGRRSAPEMLAVLADPVFGKTDERVRATPALQPRGRAPGGVVPAHQSESRPERNLLRSAGDAGLAEGEELRIARLPFTRREARAILALAPAGQRKAALDFDASRDTAMSPELARYRFVHFATHGFLNTAHPELSGIVLSLVDHEGRDQRGFLPAMDVFNLKLPADLVVLSGCRTALGKEMRGEGLIGMTRGFMYAGAARVIASLWRVDDEATAELMTRLYRRMLGNDPMRPAEALRAAQTSLWKESRWKSPYYWSAFALQGEWK